MVEGSRGADLHYYIITSTAAEQSVHLHTTIPIFFSPPRDSRFIMHEPQLAAPLASLYLIQRGSFCPVASRHWML
ncbi:hypothetical protein TYRP_023299 [Tyrophagus putrescentiae]|nr:hypothetical protein TYRP_023299 [Tyrophagus putrescentiae]